MTSRTSSPRPSGTPASGLMGGGLLARNTLLNLLGHGAPLLVALFAIPLLIAGIGAERFGVLALAWMLIGYFSVFDLGLGRALTQAVSERLGAGRPDEVPGLAWTALLLMALLGGVGAAAMYVLSAPLVERALNISPDLQAESLRAFQLLALSLPWVISTAGLRGLLEATQRFGLINAVRIPMGVFTFLGPLLVLPFSTSLVAIVAVLVVGRVIAWLVHLLFCLRVVPGLRGGWTMRGAEVGPLLRFGGWITVSGLIGPLLVYFDRFLIGAVLSMTAVAYYVTPYEVVTKLWFIPGAVVGVFFPAFALSFRRDPARTTQLFDRAARLMVLAVFPAALLIVTFAHEGLTLWVGPEFADRGATVARWLAAGVFVNCLGQVAYAQIQGAGRPDLTAKLHLAETPVYLALLWWMMQQFGIAGAAFAWALRACVDTALLCVISARMLRGGGAVTLRIARWTGAALLVLAAAAWMDGAALKSIFFCVVMIAYVGAAWRWLLADPERARLRALIPAWR